MGVHGYIDKQLGPGEQILYRAHISWVPFFVKLIPFCLIGSLLGGIAWSVFGFGIGAAIPAVALLAGLAFQSGTILYNLGVDIVVTNKRLHSKHGLVTVQDDRETSLSRIDDSDIDWNSIIGRAFGYGNISIQTLNGTENFFNFKNVADPGRLKSELNRAREKFANWGDANPVGAGVQPQPQTAPIPQYSDRGAVIEQGNVPQNNQQDMAFNNVPTR